MSKYTDEMIAEMKELAPFTYDKAQAFATKHEISLRSVIAKVRALELPYQPKDPKVRSAARKTRAKSDIVTSIHKSLGLELASLPKMTVADLESLEKALA